MKRVISRVLWRRMLVEGQVEGGISMGVGFALQEEILFDAKGRQVNPNLTNYIMEHS